MARQKPQQETRISATGKRQRLNENRRWVNIEEDRTVVSTIDASSKSAMGDIDSDNTQKIPEKLQGSDVSKVTGLLEEAMTTGADANSIAKAVSAFPNKNRVTALRNKSTEEITQAINDWRNGLETMVQERQPGNTGNYIITAGNAGGNSGSSDLVATFDDGTMIAIETKFGAATNSAPGLSRMNNLFGGSGAFQVSPEDKDALVDLYVQDPTQADNHLNSLLTDHASQFNEHPPQVNSAILYDMIKSSGSEGNSDSIDDYVIVNFGVNKKGEGTMKTTPLNIQKDDMWDVRAEAEPNGNRLNYIFTSHDGKKMIRMTHNNKNSNYYVKSTGEKFQSNAKKKKEHEGDLIQIPSKYQTGIGSYNVWYKEID